MRSIIIIAKTSIMIPELHKLHFKIKRLKYDQTPQTAFSRYKKVLYLYVSQIQMRVIPRRDNQRDNKYGTCNCIKENL